ALKGRDGEIPVSAYHEEINTLKIDKLSNRVTIISIIIPFLIGAVLVYAYLDIKKRMVDVDLTKQTQLERISQQLEEKLNALDVKIAKNRFALDNKLPEISKKTVSIEGHIAKLTNEKADNKAVKNKFKKLEKQVANNANQDKTNTRTIERINKQILSTINENQNKFDETAKQIKDEINLFKEEFDARLLELSDYEQQIGELRKDTSLLDKKFKALEQDIVSKAVIDKKINLLKTDLTNQVNSLNKKLAASISRLQKDLDRLSKSMSVKAPKNIKPAGKPKPRINIDSSGSTDIKEESLTQ
ncbi:MAG: hypothetical protein GXP56_02505, partial [Deltaproteobacteria bacterium]|nr:hypothetical protein [Deltaproteobacteria bacterium]